MSAGEQHPFVDEIGWPFLVSEALTAGLVPERAMRTLYEPVYPGVYAPSGISLTAVQRARAAWLWSRRRGVVAGQSAAALLGAKWVDGGAPAELAHANRRAPALLRVHTDTLLDDEVTVVDGITVTNSARTAFDIGRRSPRLQAVQRLDALANATNVKVIDVERVAARHRGARGVRRLRDVLPLVDGGAESPQETRTRLALIDAGLPEPQIQIEVFDDYGCFIARIDMGWQEWRVGVEYDGAQHWTDPARRARDIDRLVALTDCGWIIIRVSSDMLRNRLGTVLGRVDEALTSRGWRP